MPFQHSPSPRPIEYTLRKRPLSTLLSLGSLSLIPARRHLLTFSCPTPIHGHNSISTSCVIPPFPTQLICSSSCPVPGYYRPAASVPPLPTTRRSEEATLPKSPRFFFPCSSIKTSPFSHPVESLVPPEVYIAHQNSEKDHELPSRFSQNMQSCCALPFWHAPADLCLTLCCRLLRLLENNSSPRLPHAIV
jgi:hypothetical protein